MGPRLAPLVLLLLILCSLTSAGSMYSDPALQEKEDVMHVKYMSVYREVSDRSVEAMNDNGILCAFEDANLADKLKQIFYGTADRNEVEENEAALRELQFDCQTATDLQKTTDEYKCFCEEKKIIIYCVAEKYKKTINAPKTTCPKELLNKIKPISSLLADFFDFPAHYESFDLLQTMRHPIYEKDAQVMSWNGDPEKAKFYCATIDPDVIAALDLLPTTDSFYKREVQPGPDRDLTYHVCQDDEKKTKTWFGECVCPEKKLHDYCVLYAQAKYMIEEGYLMCDCPEKAFDKTRKPNVPFDVETFKKVAPTPTVCPTTTTSPPSSTMDPARSGDAKSAVAFFSWLPMFVAAAMLALRH